jgi:hypothetical protein
MARGRVVSGTTLDPFAVDEDRWLEALAIDWGRLYLISVNEGRWYAVARDGSGNALIAAAPGWLADAMQADFSRLSTR